MYRDNLTIADIGHEVGVSSNTVSRVARAANLPRRCNPWPMRHDAFAQMEDPAARYFLGLLMADGCVNDQSNRICISLHRHSRDSLEELCDFVGSPRDRIYDYPATAVKGPHSMVVLTSAQMTADLMRWGVHPRKGRGSPELPPELIDSPEAWRGLIDGDGSVYFLRAGTPGISLSGRRSLVKQWAAFAQRCGLPDERNLVVREGGNHILNFTGTAARHLIGVLYADAEGPAMNYKAALAAKALAWQTRTERGTVDLPCMLCGEPVRRKLSQVVITAFCSRDHYQLFRDEHKQDPNQAEKDYYSLARGGWSAPNSPTVKHFQPILRRHLETEGLRNLRPRLDINRNGNVLEGEDGQGPIVIWLAMDVKMGLLKVRIAHAEGKRIAAIHLSSANTEYYHYQVLPTGAKGSRVPRDVVRGIASVS